MATLKEKTAKGLFWGGMNNGVQQVIGVVCGILLGRILSPDDYGMMAMISVFSLIAAALQNSGFKTGLANLKNPRHEDYNSVFWFNIIVGISIYIVLFFCAPLIARFYNKPELTSLCRYAFLGFVIASFGTAQSAYLFKNMRVGDQAKTGMIAVVVSSLVGVMMAWKGYAYWSLATQANMFVLVNTILLWHFSDWRPTLEIDFSPVKRMFPFSVKILLSSVLEHINNNVLNILLGVFLGERKTGYYNQAYQWNSKCFSLVQEMVKQVAQPVLVDLQDDHNRQLNALRKMVRFTAFISFPLLLGFGLIARPFIVLALTEKWLPSVELIQIMCFMGAVMPISTLLNNLIISKGRSDTLMWCTLIQGVVNIVLMLITYPYGLRTMVTVYAIFNILWVIVLQQISYRLERYRLLSFLKDTVPFALAAAGVMGVTYLLTSTIENLWLTLLCRIVLASVLYFIVMKTAKVKILDECIRFITRSNRR